MPDASSWLLSVVRVVKVPAWKVEMIPFGSAQEPSTPLGAARVATGMGRSETQADKRCCCTRKDENVSERHMVLPAIRSGLYPRKS